MKLLQFLIAFVVNFEIAYGQTSATIPEMQTKILNQISNAYPDIRTYIRENVAPFFVDGKSTIQFGLNMGNNFLNKFGVFSPFPEWFDVVYGVAEGIAAVPVFWDRFYTDKDLNEDFDEANVELRSSINELFAKATEDIKKSACTSKVISSMNIYTNAIMSNITLASKTLKTAFLNDAKNERTSMANIFTWFNNNATICNNKVSNELTLNCTMTAIQKDGATVITYAQNLRHFIRDLIDRHNRSFKEYAARVADNLEKKFAEAFNIPCVGRRFPTSV